MEGYDLEGWVRKAIGDESGTKALTYWLIDNGYQTASALASLSHGDLPDEIVFGGLPLTIKKGWTAALILEAQNFKSPTRAWLKSGRVACTT